MTDKINQVLVIGDVHGHADRLRALLEQERPHERGARVIQLGDLGHFGEHTMVGDLECWRMALEGEVDTVLWGNHDRAVIDTRHMFGGYCSPPPETVEVINQVDGQGRLKLAEEAHGWLLTHAGLHPQIRYMPEAGEVDRTDPRALADWINTNPPSPFRPRLYGGSRSIVDAIGPHRGGGSTFGGVLWRDIQEKLYDGVPQVFGHSANRKHAVRGEADRWYCVDIGGKGDRPSEDCLAAIWLPSQEIVRVDLDLMTEEIRGDLSERDLL